MLCSQREEGGPLYRFTRSTARSREKSGCLIEHLQWFRLLTRLPGSPRGSKASSKLRKSQTCRSENGKKATALAASDRRNPGAKRKTGESVRFLARSYGVSPNTISRVRASPPQRVDEDQYDRGKGIRLRKPPQEHVGDPFLMGEQRYLQCFLTYLQRSASVGPPCRLRNRDSSQKGMTRTDD